jgi:hypothetical protein
VREGKGCQCTIKERAPLPLAPIHRLRLVDSPTDGGIVRDTARRQRYPQWRLASDVACECVEEDVVAMGLGRGERSPRMSQERVWKEEGG